MTDLERYITLSLLPSWQWRIAAERLRSGESLERVEHVLVAERAASRSGAPSELRCRAAAAVGRGQASGATPLLWRTPDYPAALDTILDPPFVLWTRGTHVMLQRPAVAIVGSRAASAYALAVAARLAGDLASRGVVVISGLARGVDSAAHQGALDGGGATVAVLGSGVDVIYPREHHALARRVIRSGALVSELAPGTPPRPEFFPLRNRIISGLSRATVVVEAGERSGSLITARSALEQGREVLAVPGSVLSARNRGAHALLRDGAKMVESADDILEEIGWPISSSTSAQNCTLPPDEPDDLRRLVESLAPGEASDLDEIAARTGLGAPEVLPRLLELELAGRLKRVGGRFVRS